MSRSLASIRILVIAVSAIVGCSRNGQLQKQEVPKSGMIDSPVVSYVGCDESDADQVLLLAVTVPDLLDDEVFRVPFRNSEGEGEYFGGGGSSFSGTGPDGGANGFIAIESSTDTTLWVRVELSWSSSQAEGEFREVLGVPIGKSGEKEFPKDRRIKWSFAQPSLASED